MQLGGSLSILLHCLSLGLEWKLTFSSPVATAEFSKFGGILSAEELMLLNCGVGEDSCESLRLQGDPTSPSSSYRKSDLVVLWKDWCWSWNSNTLATWCEELTHWKTPWCWERLRAGEEGTTEDEMVGWHHRHNGHGFGWTPGVGDGQGGLVCCGPWGRKESDMTEWQNWTDFP